MWTERSLRTTSEESARRLLVVRPIKHQHRCDRPTRFTDFNCYYHYFFFKYNEHLFSFGLCSLAECTKTTKEKVNRLSYGYQFALLLRKKWPRLPEGLQAAITARYDLAKWPVPRLAAIYCQPVFFFIHVLFALFASRIRLSRSPVHPGDFVRRHAIRDASSRRKSASPRSARKLYNHYVITGYWYESDACVMRPESPLKFNLNRNEALWNDHSFVNTFIDSGALENTR